MSKYAPSTLDSETARERLMDGRAWEDFCDRMKGLGAEMLREDVPDNELDRAEGFRHLTRMMSYALDLTVEHSDVDRPIFHAHPRLSWKWGGENPDNLYQHAAIDGSATYRIHGQRGTAHEFSLSASACGPMESPGTGSRRGRDSLVFAELSSRELEIEADGSFEITVSPERHEGNWLPSHPEVGFINIRQYFYDWDHDRQAEFWIERVGFEGTSPPPLDAASLGQRLDDAAAWVEHGMPYWTQWVQDEHLVFPPNVSRNKGQVAEGVQAISYGFGRFDLEPGQVMIFESEAPVARYWHVALLNFWFETLDHVHHQSCLNGHQMHVDADGRFRAVVSVTDPGVPNWLDTDGHLHGLIQYRAAWWETAPEPECRLVSLEDLRAELPAETPVVTPEQRRADLLRRRRHVLRRYHLY
ncbi:DUF1214 domain-containing protein [Myxococcota bacterium]|nr:DUF1214 domain-containing protein [Myxococcota bacterium]